MNLNEFLAQIGSNIKAARKKSGLRQIDVEEQDGLEMRHYQKIEAGQINITVETLLRLSKLFKCSVEDLVKVPGSKSTKKSSSK